MAGSLVEFFADQEDLISFLEKLNGAGEFIYTKTISEVNELNAQFNDASNMTDFMVSHESPIQVNCFLVTNSCEPLNERKIKMTDGSGIKTAIDQLYNPNSIEVKLGGEAAPETLVTTVIRTTGETKESKELFKVVKKLVVNNGKKVGSNYYVFPKALRKLELGWRLTPGIDSPPQMNLTL